MCNVPNPAGPVCFLGQAELNVTETIDCNMKYFSTMLSVTTEKHLNTFHLLTAEFEMISNLWFQFCFSGLCVSYNPDSKINQDAVLNMDTSRLQYWQTNRVFRKWYYEVFLSQCDNILYSYIMRRNIKYIIKYLY